MDTGNEAVNHLVVGVKASISFFVHLVFSTKKESKSIDFMAGMLFSLSFWLV